MSAAPPGTWQADTVLAYSRTPPAYGRIASEDAEKADVDTASAAWKHLKSVVRDDGKGVDLFDLLISSQRETQYSFYPPGVSDPPQPGVIIVCAGLAADLDCCLYTKAHLLTQP